ncbi:MAG: hypothetical protein BMS9Abin34_333 [Patescibacteria group bacterium]|nr:MAG: hypothetical protein BMS9Abin34_333 [Patescibacteria group bacterium]
MIKLKLPSLGKREEFPDQFFVLDLGGKVLKAFVLNYAEGMVARLGARKIPRADRPEDDMGNLKEAVGELKSDFPDAAPVSVVGASGPRTLAFTTVVRSSTSRDVEELTSHARETALRSAQEELRSDFGDPKLGVSELEAEILEVKEADKMEVYLFTSFADRSYLSEQAELVKRAGLSLWGFSSLPFNLVSELSKTSELNALIFDIGGAKTEISVVFGGQLMETKSFFWNFSENGNPTAFLDLWLDAVSATLLDFSEVKVFPAKMFLTGGGSSFPGLLEVVSSYPWSRDHPFEVAPDVVALEEDRLPLSLGQVALRVKGEGDE